MSSQNNFPTTLEGYREWKARLGVGPSYNLHINEEQRLALIEALRKAGVGGNQHDLETDPNYDPLHYWVDMLTELPKNEADFEEMGCWGKTKGLHGFCL